MPLRRAEIGGGSGCVMDSSRDGRDRETAKTRTAVVEREAEMVGWVTDEGGRLQAAGRRMGERVAQMAAVLPPGLGG
ncbi:hypothetical protein AMTR_s00001p00272810 [Amborella trichopoda]|uniref:Uncharacterized protein n=1 Tax=Amborella trichopoda TaxID=13333 RepID=W1NMJ0_AMBTC|nr:hypothetical protein AMTR_s00001p00272810 [Amborella trichopoda]